MKNFDRQTAQLVEWLCGDPVQFPYFKNLPEIAPPVPYKREESITNF